MIQNAIYLTEWDDGFVLKQPCKVNMETHEVFDIEYDFKTLDTLETLQNEWIVINDIKHKVVTQDKLPFWYGEGE